MSSSTLVLPNSSKNINSDSNGAKQPPSSSLSPSREQKTTIRKTAISSSSPKSVTSATSIFSKFHSTSAFKTNNNNNNNNNNTPSSASSPFLFNHNRRRKSVTNALLHPHGNHHHHVASSTSAPSSSAKDYKKLWRKAFNVVMFITRTKFIYLRERATKLTKWEVVQIREGFKSFVEEFGSAVYAEKVGKFFHHVGVAVSDEEGTKAGLQALEKSAKGVSLENMLKTDLNIVQLLKIGQQLKKNFAENVISEEELAFEAIREWMDDKKNNINNASNGEGFNGNHTPSNNLQRKNSAQNLAKLYQFQQQQAMSSSMMMSKSINPSANTPKITERDVHECLAAFGVAPGNFTEAGIKEQELLLAQSNHYRNRAGSRKDQPQLLVQQNQNQNQNQNNTSTPLLLLSVEKKDDANNNNVTGRRLSVRILDGEGTAPQQDDVTIDVRNNSGSSQTTANQLISLKTAPSSGGFQSTPEKPAPPPPSQSPLPLSTFREVFFQQKVPLNKMQRVLMLNQQQERDLMMREHSFEAVLGLTNAPNNAAMMSRSKKTASQMTHTNNNNEDQHESNLTSQQPSFLMSATTLPSFQNNNNNAASHEGDANNSKNVAAMHHPNHDFIHSLLNGADGVDDSSMRNSHLHSDDAEESESEKIGRMLKKIRVKMDLPPSLALFADPIEASHDMRDWRDRKEMQKLNSSKNRFETEGDVGKGTGVRVLPTHLGARIIQESLTYKKLIAKASDDALMRAVEKNVTRSIVDKAAVQAKSRAGTYRRSKEEEDAAKEYVESMKNKREGKLQLRSSTSKSAASVVSLTPEPESSGSHHLRTIKGLSIHQNGEGNETNADNDDDNLPGWLKRAQNRRNFVPFMSRPIPRSDLSRHLRDALPRKSPSELCGGIAMTFTLSDEQRAQLGQKMMQDQQDLQRELMMSGQQQDQEQQQNNNWYGRGGGGGGDTKMAASMLLDVLVARRRDEEMQHEMMQQQQQQHSLQQITAAPQQPEWANQNSRRQNQEQVRPRASSVPL